MLKKLIKNLLKVAWEHHYNRNIIKFMHLHENTIC